MTRELARVDDRTVLAQYGPMRLTIQAWGREGPDVDLAAEAGRFSFSLLARLVPARSLFQKGSFTYGPREPDFGDPLLNKMYQSARRIGLPSLGPMAAVAGVVADEVTMWLKEAGARKAIVENGGDLAVYLEPGQTAQVGLRLSLMDPAPKLVMNIDGGRRDFWGIASSGFGGRGLTQGIASTAMCVAESGALADAAATAVAGSCRVDSPAVKMVPAERLVPETDIPGLLVTESVGPLQVDEIELALKRGLAYAQSLIDQGLLIASMIALNNRVVFTDNWPGPLPKAL